MNTLWMGQYFLPQTVAWMDTLSESRYEGEKFWNKYDIWFRKKDKLGDNPISILRDKWAAQCGHIVISLFSPQIPFPANLLGVVLIRFCQAAFLLQNMEKLKLLLKILLWKWKELCAFYMKKSIGNGQCREETMRKSTKKFQISLK